MKPRLAILSMLAAGILLMGAGTGLAISGISSSDNASVAEYPTTTGGVAGQQTAGKPCPDLETHNAEAAADPTPNCPKADAAGATAGEARQLAASGGDGTLPFTGFAAIPVIFAGLGLLVAGLVVRRRTAANS